VACPGTDGSNVSIPMDARSYAEHAHRGQMYGSHPYVHHLDEVVGILRSEGMGHLSDAGYLHDVLEDTPVLYAELLEAFPHAAPTVEKCSGYGRNRKEKQASIKLKLVGDCDAQTVKAADRLANVRSCLRDGNPRLLSMYRQEMVGFLDTIPLAPEKLRNLLSANI